MKILGYQINNRNFLINGCVIAGAVLVNTLVVYAVVNTQCGNLSSEESANGFSTPAQSSCNYLRGNYLEICPEGYPATYDLCVQGFREGINLIQSGFQNFVPEILNGTYCDEYFGGNETEVCYQNLVDKCWAGVWGGFVWQKSTTIVREVINNNCADVASSVAWATAGLTLFTGLVNSGANAFFGRSKPTQGLVEEPVANGQYNLLQA